MVRNGNEYYFRVKLILKNLVLAAFQCSVNKHSRRTKFTPQIDYNSLPAQVANAYLNCELYQTSVAFLRGVGCLGYVCA